MSLLANYECPWCFKYTGYAGFAARRDPLRKHLACDCPSDAELDLRERIEAELKFTMEMQQRKDAA